MSILNGVKDKLRAFFKWVTTPVLTNDETAHVIYAAYKLIVILGILSGIIAVIVGLVRLIQRYHQVIELGLEIVVISVFFILYQAYRQNKFKQAERMAYQNQVPTIVFNSMLALYQKLHDRLGIVRPLEVGDIMPPQYFRSFGDVTIFVSACVKNSTKVIDDYDLRLFKGLLQNELDKLIQGGKVFAPAFIECNFPPMVVVDVSDTENYLVVEVIYVVDNSSRDYVQRLNNITQPQIEPRVEISSQHVDVPRRGIPIAYNEDMLFAGIPPKESIVIWDYEKSPHMLVTGHSGSGKSTYDLIILHGISGLKEAQIWVADFKGEDFAFLNGYERLYLFQDCGLAIEEFYTVLKNRQSNRDASRTPCFLLVDELAAFVTSIDDKRVADHYKSIISELAMLTRSFNMHLCFTMQRADSVFWGAGGARDNITNSMTVCFGHQSKETTSMLFPDFKDMVQSDRSVGTGYLLMGGHRFLPFKSQWIQDTHKLKSEIRKRMLVKLDHRVVDES